MRWVVLTTDLPTSIGTFARGLAVPVVGDTEANGQPCLTIEPVPGHPYLLPAPACRPAP